MSESTSRPRLAGAMSAANAFTSSGVGSVPMRSRYRRRANSPSDAGGDGRRFRRASLRSMSRSMKDEGEVWGVWGVWEVYGVWVLLPILPIHPYLASTEVLYGTATRANATRSWYPTVIAV